MSEKETNCKKEQALRIMEALSGVDEELLERSRKPTDEKEEKKAFGTKAEVFRFVWKHRRAFAACLCLAVLGTAIWGMSRVIPGPYKSRNSSEFGAMEPRATEFYDGATAGGAEVTAEMAEAEEMAEDNTISRSMAEAEPQWGDMYPDESVEISTEISWEEAYSQEKMGRYIPTEVPDGYEPVYACLSTTEESGKRLTLRWSNGKDNLWLNITESEWRGDTGSGSAQPVLTEEENWEQLLPEPSEDGSIQFGLLYKDGILVEYHGYLETEEIIQMFSFSSMR